MVPVQIMINRLLGNYSSSCYFKIKIILSSSPNKESAESKHSYKYEKGKNEINIYETLEINQNVPLTSESKFQFFLEVYTKTGYKTAGVGVYHLSKGISLNVPIQIEIKKCPLGKGHLEIQFLNFSINPITKSNVNIIPLKKKMHGSHSRSPSKNSENSFYNQKSEISDISYITNITNIVPTKQPNIYDNNNNIFTTQNSNINTNNNDDILKEKNRQINELKTKIDYYNEENNELKNLVEDFKKEKKAINEEKNKIINQQKDKYQKLLNEKEDFENQNVSLKQNLNNLKNNKAELEQKIKNIKIQNEKQIKDLMTQVQNYKNIKLQLEDENKIKDEQLHILDKKLKEMATDYQNKFSELKSNYAAEKNRNMINYNEKLKMKEEEIIKLNIKIQTLEENIQSLNEEIEINNRKKIENDESTKNKRKLLEQLSSKDEQIFDLKKEISNLKNKILTESNNRKTQTMLNGINEKELKSKISELQILLNDKEEEILELQEKYDNLKYESKRLKPKLKYVNIDDEEGGDDNGNNSNFVNQLKEMQKTYKEREEKLIREKNEEIKKLRIRNQSLERESNVYNNDKSTDIRKYLNEIKKLKNINNNLEDDLKYYKELNNKYVENEKRNTTYESENLKLQNLIQKKDEEIEEMLNQQKKMEEENRMLERQLINSKGKLGEVLNELAEVESKCVYLEQNQLKKNEINGQSD